MILVGTLSAQALRTTYLRGIDLGAAWQGPGGDAALNTLLMTELERAEELMGIHWRRWRVAAPPDAGMVEGTHYDVPHHPIPYAPPRAQEDFYRVALWHHDVQEIAQVRLWVGMSQAAPVYTTVDLAQVTYLYPEEVLHIPVAAVPQPDAVLGWAVDYVIGVGRLPLSVVQWCSLGAAIQVLSLGAAAADVSHGLDSQRLIMDGVDETLRYGTGANGRPGGMYAGVVATLQLQRDEIDLVKLRFRYQGSHFPPPHRPFPSLPLPPPSGGGLGEFMKYVATFAQTDSILLPGTQHGMGTADLGVFVYDPQNNHLLVPYRVDPATYDILIPLVQPMAVRVVVLA